MKIETLTEVLMSLVELVGKEKADQLLTNAMAQHKHYYLVQQALGQKLSELQEIFSRASEEENG